MESEKSSASLKIDLVVKAEIPKIPMILSSRPNTGNLNEIPANVTSSKRKDNSSYTVNRFLVKILLL
ncbi:MAG: hypothetical protein H0U75_05205 [Legionella sp.]|nr:hypothetical protein [Legionella sp.]